MAEYFLRADGTAANKAAAVGPQDDTTKCMSIATHNAETFSAGDILTISGLGGNYSDTLQTPSAGASGNVITYNGVNGATLDGQNRTVATGIILNKDYLKFTNINGQEYLTNCMTTSLTPVGIEFQTCSFTGSDDQLVNNDGTIVYRNCVFDGGADEAVSIHTGADVSLYDCIIKDTVGDGGLALQAAGTGITIYIDGCQISDNKNISVDSTSTFNMWRSTMGISGTGDFIDAGNSTINFCRFNFTADGVTSASGRLKTIDSTTMHVNNCVMYSVGDGGGYGCYPSENSTINFNNTIFEKYRFAAYPNNAGSVVNFTNVCDNTIVSLTRTGGSGTSSETDTLTADPLILASGRINSLSPCIDAGVWIESIHGLGPADLWGKYIYKLVNIGVDQGAGAPVTEGTIYSANKLYVDSVFQHQDDI
jgi:hypothetical protein